MRLVGVVLAITLALVAAPVPAAAAPGGVAYAPPVDAGVVDPFRPPASPYGPGNRGLDYATAPGTVVRASAGGEVVFAGLVGGSSHVVVLHADGLRTSYSFLATTAVRRGDAVAAGQPVGTTAGALHFGARAGDAYVDPAALFGTGPPRVHLVADDLRRPGSEAEERGRLERTVRSLPGWAARVGAGAVGWARDGAGLARDLAPQAAQARLDELRGWLHYASAFRDPVVLPLVAAAAARRYLAERDGCTPSATAPPPLPGRRLVVLVGGLGSSSGDAAAFGVDTAALGYAPGDRHEFSYAGGDAPYGPTDTQVDIRDSGRRLRDRLERLAREHPGVPIDVVAHSQGGLVARSALAEGLGPSGPDAPAVRTVVTLGTPHHGADLATAARMAQHTDAGEALGRLAAGARLGGIDPASTSVGQMAEHSDFVRELNERPLPEGVRFVSIAARTDWVVPVPRSHLDGAVNVVVDPGGGLLAHDALPASPAARRELALVLAGAAPTCEDFADAFADQLVGTWASQLEDLAGMALNVAGHRLDRGSPSPGLPRPVPPARPGPAGPRTAPERSAGGTGRPGSPPARDGALP